MFVERQWLLANPIAWVIFPVAATALWVAREDPQATWGMVLVVAVIGLLATGRMRTTVDVDGVRIIYWPIRRRTQTWTDVTGAEAIDYRWTRYGGWGIRFGERAVAYTVWGRQAVRLHIDGKRDLVIGTRDPDALLAAIHEQGGVPVGLAETST